MILKPLHIGVLFFLTISSGVWLSNSGKPFNTAIFTVHKLIALAAVVFTVILIRNLFTNVEFNSGILTLVIVSGVFILALFISGALLSLNMSPYNLIKVVHNVATISAVITIVVTIYRLVIKV